MTPGEWVHVAVGNERMLKTPLPFMAPHLEKGGKPVRGASKVSVKREWQQRVIDFHARWSSNTVVFVSIDDELAMCMALGGACDDCCMCMFVLCLRRMRGCLALRRSQCR